MTVEQGSDAWRQLRVGKITASNFKHVLAIRESGKREGEPLAARDSYMRMLAFERLSGQPVHEIHSKSLAWGKTHEAAARLEFEIRRGAMTQEVDFIVHPDMPFVGCSPDSLVGDDSGLEIKCPMTEGIHLKTWREGMPDEHMPQVQGAMLVTGRKQWEFLSYDDRLAGKPIALYHQTIRRDDFYIEKLERALYQFELELRELVKWYETRAETMWRIAA